MNRLLATLFAALALASGIIIAAVTPPGQVADEVAHVIRADSLTHGKFLGRKLPSQQFPDILEGNTFADAGLVRMAIDSLIPGHRLQTKASMAEVRQIGWAGKPSVYQIGPLAGYMPAFYVPSAIGLGVGRLIGISPYNAMQAGRLLNVVVFAALGTLALLVARRGRAVMLCVLSVPMTLSLAASFNQDGLLIASAVLAAALASRAWDHADIPEDIPRQAWFWAAAGLIAVIGTVKPPYLSLAAMLLLPLPADWRSGADRDALWQRLGIAVLVCVPGLLWLLLAIPSATGNLARAAYEAGPLWPGPRPAEFHATDLRAQMHVLLSHPLRFLTLPAVSFFTNPNLPHESVGVLGWLNILLPRWLYTAWNTVFVLAVLGDMLSRPAPLPASAARPSAGWRSCALETALLILAAVAAVWAIYISQYLAWTNVGMARIEGPTGRYLLPVIPLIGLALPRLALPWRLAGGLALGRVLRWAPLLALVVGIYAVPRVLLTFFYLP